MFLMCEFSGSLLTPCTYNPVKRGKDWAPCCLDNGVPELGLSLSVSQCYKDVKIVRKYELTSLWHQCHPLQKSTLTVLCPSDKWHEIWEWAVTILSAVWTWQMWVQYFTTDFYFLSVTENDCSISPLREWKSRSQGYRTSRKMHNITLLWCIYSDAFECHLSISCT